MKFGQSEKSLLQRRSIRLLCDALNLLLSVVFVYFYYARGKLSQGLFLFAVFLLLYFRLRRNIEKPPFEIEDNILYFKNYWGSIKEYPLKNFEGRIYTLTVFPNQSLLVAPGLHKYGNKIDISGLRKKERLRFIEHLKQSVTDIKNTGDEDNRQ